jgi:hypothetical protein
MSKAAELAALIGSQTALSNRNLVINGAMQVAQRGTSSTGQGASDLFLVDRFHLNTNGNSAGRFTVTQESDGPSGIPNSLKLACTTADTSIAASERFFIEQRLEGQDCQRLKKGTSDAEAITVSFYVKGNAAATYVVGIYDSDNSRQIGAQFSVTTSWNRVSVTFPADTGGSALDDDNAESLSLRFYLHAGSTYTGGTLQTTWDTAVANEQVGSGTTSIFDSTSRTFFLTGVQLEVGEQATPFEHRSYADELRRCLRYYYQLMPPGSSDQDIVCTAALFNTMTAFGAITMPQPMRTTPTLDAFGGTNYWTFYSNGTQDLFDTFAILNAHPGAVQIYNNQSISATAGQAGNFQAANNDCYVSFDAEL